MFCPKCGKQVEDDAKFCLACGAVLAIGATSGQPSAQDVWRAAQTTLAQSWAGGASLTLIAVYMVLNTLYYGIGAFLLGIMAVVPESLAGIAGNIVGGQMSPSEIGAVRGIGVLLSLGNVLSVAGTVLAGAGAIGIFTRQLWGRMVTRAFLVLDVVLSIISLLVGFSAAVFTLVLFNVGVAVFIWIHLSHPRVEALLKPEQ